MQFKKIIFRRNYRVIKPLFLALFDLLIAIPKLFKQRNAMTSEEYKSYNKLEEAKIYWTPEIIK